MGGRPSQEPTTPSPSDRIGRYRLVRQLGRGGMGEVWEALLEGPLGFSKPVALKILTRVDREETWSALVSEARLGALLQHPNVVSALELGEVDGVWFVAMELVQGASLLQIGRAGPLSASAVLDVGVQACQALTHIHELRVGERPAGLVHRDVKPANLLVDATGLVKLADLGIARLGHTTDRSGTSGYMAPEQLVGDKQDARCDLFSLGVTLCNLATGARAFQTADAVLRRVPPKVLDEVDAAVPGLGLVVGRCLQVDPEARWPDARALQSALVDLRTSRTGASLLDLLRGVRPDLVTEVTGIGVTESTTILRPRGNLPLDRDRRFGREPELEALCQQVRDGARLITLLGTGGVGKTRLACAAGRVIQDQLEGGSWFLDVSEARTPQGLCLAVARDLSLPTSGDSVAAVGAALAALGPALVVLDNLEQCVEVAAGAVPRWLEAAPEVRLLCTSRIALGVRGEVRVPVGPLATEHGVALLRDRSGRPELDEADARALVEAVDGLPLAIELAAARLRQLPIRAVLDRLGDRLRLLAGGAADRPERHRSLRASLDASVELLSPWTRAALAQLSVFEGGFTYQAAEAVLDLGEWPDAGWALEAVQELGSASLLVRTGARFTMLQVVHEYASALLEPDARAACEGRHGAWFAQLGGEDTIRATRGPGGAEVAREMAAELDNLIAACRRAVAARLPRVAAGTARAAHQVLQGRGPLGLAVELLEEVLTLQGLTRGERTMLTYNLAWAAYRLHDLERARVHFEAGLQTVETPIGEANLRAALALVHRGQERPAEARVLLEQARVLFEEHGPAQSLGEVVGNLGLVALDAHDLDGAEARFREARALLRESGYQRGEGIVVGNLALVASRRGRWVQGRALLLEAIELHVGVGNRWFEAHEIGNLAYIDLVEEDLASARAHFERGTQLAIEVGNLDQAIGLLAARCLLELDAGSVERARVYLDRVLVLARTHDSVLPKLRPIQATVLAAEGRLDEADALLERTLPGLLVATDPRERASPLMFAARVALYRDDVERAAELLDEVDQLLESLPAPSRLTEHSLRRVRRRLAGLPPFVVG